MIIIDSVADLRRLLAREEKFGTGFVPTMGALHRGHLSLVKQSSLDNKRTVVSIFVNPTQFNDTSDLEKYPRDLETDLSMLSNILSDKDIVFTPNYNDLYSFETEFSLDLMGLDQVMEGSHRPGHFEGVVRVVKLLFEAVTPEKAYFGQKDFQQLTIIKKMVKELNMGIEIIACPILREANGLAMSSRNERLSEHTRSLAAIIHSTLKEYCKVKSANELTGISQKIKDGINSVSPFLVEYFEIVDNISLRSVSSVSDIMSGRKYYGCIAVYAEEVRLIDNVEFSFAFIKG
ncbi:MAG: pantoate--beta-alanine ligase [Bacteroidales bacterium]|nr:pantoate--beta-alanine ligase [Bacteroidales bacterium]